MTTVSQRKFGTDLSNTRRHTVSPKKRAIQKQFINGNKKFRAVDALPQPISVTDDKKDFSNKENELISGISNLVLPVSPVRDAKSVSASTANETTEAKEKESQCAVEATNDMISQEDQTNFRYSRQFLLSFKDKYTEPIEGLLPEVKKGYVDPVALRNGWYSFLPESSTVRSFAPRRSLFKDTQTSSPATESTSTPGVSFTPFVPPQTTLVNEEQKSEVEVPVNSQLIKLEWKPKPVKKEKSKESDDRRLAQRQKQLDIGKNTPGYQKYSETISKSSRKKGDPKTPNKYQLCSKRSWDGQVRKWRRQLHVYDPPGLISAEGDEDLDDNIADEEGEEVMDCVAEVDADSNQTMTPMDT